MSSRTSSATMSRTTTSKRSIGVSASPCASPAAPSHRERGGALAVAAAPTGDVQGLRDPSRPPRSVRRPGFGGRRPRGRRPGAKAQVRGGRGAGAGLHQALLGRDRRGDCLVALAASPGSTLTVPARPGGGGECVGMTLGTRVHRLAMGCAGILLGSGFALGSIPALAAAAPLRAPRSSGLVASLGSAPHEGPGAVSGVETSPLLPAGSHSEPAVAQGSITEGSYVSVTPARIVDTRAISAGGSGGAYAGQTLAAGATLTVPVIGEGGVPTTGVAAVVLNVTAVDPTAAGFLTVLPGGTTVPTGSAAVSNVNFAAGATVANLVTVGLSATGTVEIYNYTGSTDVVVDVDGYYTSTASTNGSGLYNPLSPYRDLGTLAIGQAIAEDASQAVTVTGTASGVPSSATAVVVNVTAADATASSFLTVYPAGVSTPPQASNLNFGAQAPLQAIANRVTVGVGAGGQIEVYNYTGTVNVDVDVDGYYTGSGGTGSAFVAITPVRLFDTRTATLVGTGTPIAASGIESFSLTNTTIPSNAAAVAANFTVVPGAAPGYLTVYPEADGN